MKKFTKFLSLFFVAAVAITLAACSKKTETPTTTKAPAQTTTQSPAVTTTKAPVVTTKAPEVTTKAPTTTEPQVTTTAPHTHSGDGNWYSDDTNHYHVCTEDNEHFDVEAHNFGAWGETTAPSYDAPGVETRTCSVCGKAETRATDQWVHVSSIELDKTETIYLDSTTNSSHITATVTATVLPENAHNKKITWKTSDEFVVEVNNGVITAVGEGTATITVETEDQKLSKTISVVVYPFETDVEVGGYGLLNVGGTITLTATLNPLPTSNVDASETAITWTSSNTSVATVDANGVVTGVAEGATTITLTTKHGITKSLDVMVVGTGDSKPFVAEFAGNTNVPALTQKVFFSEGGFRISARVDGHISQKSTQPVRTELAFMLSDTNTETTTFTVRVYTQPVEGRTEYIRMFKYYPNASGTYKWSELTGDNMPKVYFYIDVHEEYYTFELYIPFTSLGCNAFEAMKVVTACIYNDSSSNTMTASTYNFTSSYQNEHLYDIEKAISFDKNGYVYDFEQEDLTLTLQDLNEGGTAYERELTLAPAHTTPLLNAQLLLGDALTGKVSLTEVGNGVYKLSIAKENEVAFATPQEITLKAENKEYKFNLAVDAKIYATSVSIDNEVTAPMAVGSTLTLTTTILPADTTVKTLTFTSSNEQIATVSSEGVVTAVSEGMVTITATALGGKTASIDLLVFDTKETIKYNYTSTGETNAPTATIDYTIGENGVLLHYVVTDHNVKSTSSNATHTEIGIHMKGDAICGSSFQLRIYPIKFGERALVRVYYLMPESQARANGDRWEEYNENVPKTVLFISHDDAGYEYSIYLPYAEFGVTKEEVNIASLSYFFFYNDSDAMKNRGTLAPNSTANTTMLFSFSDSLGNSGKQEFDAKGYKYTIDDIEDITISMSQLSEGNFVYEFEVKAPNINPLTGLTFTGTGSEYISEVGNGTYKLTIPEAQHNAFADFATITIVDARESGKTFKFKIDYRILPQSISFTNDYVELEKNATEQLTVTYNPTDTDVRDVTFESSSTEIATVSATGLITAVSDGFATITATTSNGKTAQMVVRVGKGEVYLSFDNGENKLANTGSGTETADYAKLDVIPKSTAFVSSTFEGGSKSLGAGSALVNSGLGKAITVSGFELGTGDFTISMWLYVPTNSVISKGNGTYLFGNNKVDGENPNLFRACLRSDASGNMFILKANNQSQISPKIDNLNLDAFNNFVMVRKGTLITIYVNGVKLSGSITLNGDIDFGSKDLGFGAYFGDTWTLDKGNLFLDNVMLLKQAMTDEQVSAYVSHEAQNTQMVQHNLVFDNTSVDSDGHIEHIFKPVSFAGGLSRSGMTMTFDESLNGKITITDLEDGTYKLTILDKTAFTTAQTITYNGQTFTVKYVDITPEALFTFDNGTNTNTGSNNEITGSSVYANAANKGTEYVAQDTVYRNGIDGDTNGAINVTNTANSGNPWFKITGVDLGTSDFTLVFDFYLNGTTNLSTGNSSPLFCYGGTVDGKVLRATVRNENSGYFSFACAASGTAKGPTRVNGFIHTGWNQFAVVRSGTTINYYINQRLIDTVTIAADKSFGANDLVFGGYLGETWSYSSCTFGFDNITLYKSAIETDQLLTRLD